MARRPGHREAVGMSSTPTLGAATAPPRLPPAPVIKSAWRIHRLLYRVSGGRFLWTPANKRGWGALRLTTTGRRSGADRSVILAYLTHGDGWSVVAMNGWLPGHPAWLLNLRAQPSATIRLKGGPARDVVAREAKGAEREAIWARWLAVDPNLGAWAAARSTPTPVVVLEPSAASAGAWRDELRG